MEPDLRFDTRSRPGVEVVDGGWKSVRGRNWLFVCLSVWLVWLISRRRCRRLVVGRLVVGRLVVVAIPGPRIRSERYHETIAWRTCSFFLFFGSYRGYRQSSCYLV